MRTVQVFVEADREVFAQAIDEAGSIAKGLSQYLEKRAVPLKSAQLHGGGGCPAEQAAGG